MEVKLDSLFQLLRKKGNSNQDYLTINKAFKLQLKKVLKLDEAFIHDFKFLKKSMSTITSPDGAFRLFNWNIEMESGVNNFHCFILTKKGKIIELRDNYRFIENPEFKSLTQRNWYGALYYKIIPMKKGKYTLLGWNGKDEITTQKVIETMSISRRSAKFGLDIFEYPGERINKKRVIVEYANDAFVAMKFYNNKDSKQIVFSHVGPSTPQVEGFYQYYYPDGTDSFELTNKGNWLFKLDSKYLNPKSKVDSQWKLPKENAPN
ncbi:MAG: hypothetical protein ABF258_00960 [Flavobacteriales bacterium]